MAIALVRFFPGKQELFALTRSEWDALLKLSAFNVRVLPSTEIPSLMAEPSEGKTAPEGGKVRLLLCLPLCQHLRDRFWM